MAINNTWERAPWADALYACDGKWWRHYQPEFKGQRWTQDEGAAEFGAHRIPGRAGVTLSLQPNLIAWGNNSGFQALNLAIHFGASKIVLLGYDMQATGGLRHWHEDHRAASSGALNDPSDANFELWGRAFVHAARQLEKHDVTCINASRDTALTCFDRMTVQEAFDGDCTRAGRNGCNPPAGLCGRRCDGR